MIASKEISEHIQVRIKEYLARPDIHGLAEVVRTMNALPLYVDMGGALFIRPTGEIFQWDETERKATPEKSANWRLTALVVGCKKYPELKALLPLRSPAEVDCVTCEGSGKMVFGEHSLLCGDCSGLGWHATSRYPPRQRALL